MGSVYAGILGDAGNEVWAIDVWAEHVEAIRHAWADRRGRERTPHRADPRHLRPGRGRRVRPRRDRDEGAPRRGRRAVGETVDRAGDRRAADPERPRQRRPDRGGPRRGTGRDRRRRRLRRLGRRAGARPPQRLGARPPRRAPRAGDPAHRARREGVAGRGLPRPGLRRRRPARLGEAHLQRLLQRHLHGPRADDPAR